MFIISNFLGKLLIKKEDSLYKLHSIFGFALLMAIFHLIYLPFILNGKGNDIYPYISIIVLGLLFVISIFKLEKEDFYFLKSPVFYFLLILGIFVYKIYYPMDAGDDAFYIPFIRDLASSKLFTIDPRSGLAREIQNIYLYQTYYLFLAAIEYFLTSANAILFIFKTYFSIIFISFLSILIKFIKDKYKIKTTIFIILFLLSIFLLGYSALTHIYWGSFALYPVFVPIYLIVLQKYFETKNKLYIYLALILNIAMISLASTALFLVALIVLTFALIDLIKRSLRGFDYLVLMLPNMLYLALLIDRLYLLYLFVLILFIFYYLDNAISSFANKYLKYLFVFVPIILYLLAKYFNIISSWEDYNMGYLIIIFNIFISLLIAFVYHKESKIDTLAAIFLVYTIAFFNPLSSSLIAKFVSNDVYHRLFFITKNPIMIIVVLNYLYQYFKKFHLSRILYLSFLIALTVLYIKVILDSSFLNKNYYNSYNYLYREESANLDLANYIKEDNILSLYYQPRIYNSLAYGKNYRYPKDGPGANEAMSKYISDLSYNDNSVYKEIKKYNYIIIFNDKKLLYKFPDYMIDYENEKYILLKKS